MEFFSSSRSPSLEVFKKKKVLVYFVGGVTYGEVAAVRFLNKLFKDKVFIVATTQMINGEGCIDMMRGNINN